MLPRKHAAVWPILIVWAMLASGGQAAQIQVSTTADEFAAGSACSLREAIHSANTNADFGGCTHTGSFGTDNVLVPAGFYSLSRDGSDDDNNASGDLDIRSNLTIQGAGAGSTSIANCGNCNDRVLQVVIGTSVSINDVTLRDGDLIGGRAGAGLRSEPNTSTTLNRVTIGLNTAEANAGGILNRGAMILNSCAVTNNVTTNAQQGGGGIFNDDNALLILNDTRVLNNTTTGNGANGDGAGIYNDVGGELVLSNSTVDGNKIEINGNFAETAKGDGGGIYSAGIFQITQSTISNNTASGTNARGGGISCDTTDTNLGAQGNSLLSRSVVFGNEAVENADLNDDVTSGGGVYANCRELTIEDSVISSNRSVEGGGVSVDRNAIIRTTTIASNTAKNEGGGISFSTNTVNVRFSLVDSTVINNQSDDSGGGLSLGRPAGFSATARLLSSTISGNTSGGNGGGLDVEGNVIEAMGHTVIAGNLAVGSAIHDDCEGAVTSAGANLIQSASGCALTGATATDLTNVNAGLAPPANNGGPVAGASSGVQSGMLTRAPLPDSLLIDPGPGTCVDELGAPLKTDQTGRNRNLDGPDADTEADCDIGSIEFATDPDVLFASGFE